jgi:cardiolipin synthase
MNEGISGIWEAALGLALIAFQVAGIYLTGKVLLGHRSTQGTIAWALSLLLLPLAAVPLYLVFGRNRLPDYIRVRRRADAQFEVENPADVAHPEAFLGKAGSPAEKWRILHQLAKQSACDGNALRFLFSGQETFDSILDGLAGARDYILFQFFIFRDDETGRRFLNVLQERARAGVTVYFLVDAIGSRQLGRRFYRDLAESGIRYGVFKPGRTWRGRLRLNFRNHRKLVVVDGREAWVGGNNVGREYLGKDPRFGPWRDTHAHLRGPAVNPVQLTFMEDWYWTNREMLHLNWQAVIRHPENSRVHCLATGPADPTDACTLAYVHMINQAQNRLWIHTPYFVPSEEVVVALQLAALRGVDVRVLLPGRFDKWLVWLCSYYFSSLGRLANVRFYRYNTGFFHSKLLLVDEDMVSVGTVNFDNRSFQINFEITLLVEDPALARHCRRQMESDFANATLDPVNPLANKSLLFNLAARAARLLSPVL